MTPRELSNDIKNKLRKISKSGDTYDTVRNMLNAGITPSNGLSGAYIQFDKDVQIYGLYEALLYAEGYEKQGHYVEGTVSKICEHLSKEQTNA